MGIFFFKMLNIFDNSFDINFILFFGDLVIGNFYLFINLLDSLLYFVKNILLNLMFLLKLKLCIKKFIIKFLERCLIFLYILLMLGLILLKIFELIEYQIDLLFQWNDFRVCIVFYHIDSVKNIVLVTFHMTRKLIEYLIMFVDFFIKNGEVINKFSFWYWDDIVQL